MEKENKYYNNPYADPEMNVDENELYDDVKKRIHAEYDDLISDEIEIIADKYNTGNIIKLGDGISERMQKPENYIEIYSNILKANYDSNDEIYKNVLKEVLTNEIRNDEYTKETKKLLDEMIINPSDKIKK